MGIYLATHCKYDDADRFMHSWMIKKYADALNINYDNVAHQVTKKKQFSYVHFTRSDMLYSCEEQTHASTELNKALTVTLLQGHLWEKHTSNTIHNAESLTNKIKHHSAEKIRDDCSGEYSVLNLNEDKLIAFNDRLSIEHIYYAEIDGVIFISNRIRLIQEATHTRSINFDALNWMATCSNTIGEETTDTRIFRLPQGASLTAHQGKLTIHHKPLFMYKSGQSPDITEELNIGIKACTNNIVNAIRKSKSNNFPIPLSGGKDSRAILAMLLNVPLKQKLQVLTNGHESHPDVIVAKQIAEYFKLEHILTMPKMRSEIKTPSDLDIIERFPRHAFQMDGMFGAWDCQGYRPPSSRLIFAGQVGEVYRGYTSSKYKTPETLDEASKFFHLRGCFDPGNILLPDSRKILEGKLRERAIFYLDHGARLEDIPDLFYTVERIPNFVGTLRRNSGYSSRLITPLYTDELVQLAFHLGKEQRKIDRIHFEIINRSSKWLASQPFANDKWSKKLNKYSNGSKLATEGVPMPKQSLSTAPRHWRYKLNESKEFRNMLLDIFLSYPNSDIWNHYNKQTIIEALTNTENMGLFKLISFYGFINAFFYSNQIEENVKIALPKR